MLDNDNDQEPREQELKDRLALIETMLIEGRRHTQSWGWTFLLWGAAYYIALAWSSWSHNAWAWPATVAVAVVVTAVVASLKAGHEPTTALGRAVGTIWIALGITMFVLFMSLGLSGRLSDSHIFLAAVSAILGMANGASGLLLRWKVQLACAVAWWIATALTCFGNNQQSMIVFVIAVFLCQIVFGLYGMFREAKTRHGRNATHA